MNRYSWYTTTEKDSGGWYKCTAIVVFPSNTVKFDTYPFYKPNRKGGHRHNHVRNAHKRMRKCHVCGEPIVWGCEVIGYRFNEFQCRSCRTEECREQAGLLGISFGGCEFETRRRRK